MSEYKPIEEFLKKDREEKEEKPKLPGIPVACVHCGYESKYVFANLKVNVCPACGMDPFR